MSHSKTEVVVGGAVLAAAVGFLLFVSNATGFSGGGSGYPLTASFRSADGITIGTDVRLAGVKIGTVTGIALNPETFRADTTISVSENIEIPDDSAISVSSEGLLGGNFIEILPGGSPFAMETGGEFIDTQGSVSLVSLLMKFVGGDGS
ncbi:mammalian cell entry related domain protein [Dinoroseobacter shibae DFL 12 = DSM 16493]|jgi:phospholipid/cholesterol/gamma-HCH transport system substrate-binding protein|uniref:Mammalian cell entry related domain protein n=1 Tax=Dinoroseobacter shibae (strain DSM 16493 / NCIMB 14021 / DFL 12) TaxID=398580 RepID=A8LJB1_DINSH|nr:MULTISPECIES: outer membrane lipid asymmetry maintenance protein MlaD [Dinoroseobacter]ABV93133.1 mammalian cell entry related domain protein [Dinoroseobacter shibae DFL 12 = DSM 16493]MDD9716235.1 outer membrane lipid asymmetry maintenance protein MlaD [Dinoroseobacter sp. PD6]URF48059.1 outer membrane lipid asymmetry maintenance protein MlaD [Dinoroseobacter shibae]URF52369.1 outer membrane lipid asymmetry maintenance protein MlaD [Dinoroseobacter shibae]